MLNNVEKNLAVAAGEFVVTITQNVGSGENGASSPLPFLTAAVSKYSFDSDNSMLDEEDEGEEWEDDDQDYDDNEDDDEVVLGEPIFTLSLDYNISFNVIRELRDFMPLPDDTDVVVRITYVNEAGEPIFYHEFRGYPLVRPKLSGTKGDLSKLMGTLEVSCESFTLFTLATP